MQSKSLSAQIAGKSKKLMHNQEPAFFSEIPYSDVREINYLTDLQQKKKNINFPIFQFQKDFGQDPSVNDYDMLANTMYKKIMQNGYIQERKPPSKKRKKNKNPFEYDYQDQWINDEEAITVKKNIEIKLENFKCLNFGIEQFYNSDLYKSSLSQIQQQSKKRTSDIKMDAQELEEIKKKIKENISMTHSRMKQEQAEKLLGIQQGSPIEPKQIPLQIQLLKIQQVNEIEPQKQQINNVQTDVKNNEKENTQAVAAKIEQNIKAQKKKVKAAPKPKTTKKSSKTQKKPKQLKPQLEQKNQIQPSQVEVKNGIHMENQNEIKQIQKNNLSKKSEQNSPTKNQNSNNQKIQQEKFDQNSDLILQEGNQQFENKNIEFLGQKGDLSVNE